MGLIFVSAVPVFACERTQVLSFGEESTEYSFPENPGDYLIFFTGSEERPVLKFVYPVQFVDEEGNIYNAEFPQSRESCQNHDYVHGTVKKHIKNSDGSCVVKFYDGKRCSKCGKVVYGNLLDTQSYEKCPH